MTEKRWTDEDIARTTKIIQEAHKKKSRTIKALDKMVYWVALIIVLIVNFCISIVLIPFLLVLKGIYLYFILVFLGIAFGLIFDHLIRDIEDLKKGHHIFAAIFVVITAAVNMFIIGYIVNKFEILVRINNPHNLYLVGAVYSIPFLIPYFWNKIFKKE